MPSSALVAVPGDVADAEHRARLLEAAGGELDLLVNNASSLGPTPLPALSSYLLDELRTLYEVNVVARLRWPSRAAAAACRRPHRQRYLRRGRRALRDQQGYGSSKAALAQLTAILGAEQPALRVYTVDPGDMRTQMQQDAFPGEDISDRPPPEESVPGLLALIEGELPSGAYRARELVGASA